MPKINIEKLKTAKLRKMAEKAEVKNWESLERPELIKALSPEAPKKEVKPASETKKAEVKKEVKKAEAPKPEKIEDIGIKGEHAPMGSKAARMKEILAKQPKVTILIPLEGDEKMGVTFSVILNGYRLNILKGAYVQVPQQIAEVVQASQKQTRIALEHRTKIKGSKSELD